MNKKDIIKIIFFGVAFLIFIFAFTNNSIVSGKSNKEEYKVVIVEKGDTLWNIAENNCKNNSDTRKNIYYIRKTNNLSSANIRPGQEIKIPVKLCGSLK